MDEQNIATAPDSGPAEIDPGEQLFGFLCALRGGYRVNESLLFYDYMAWVAVHGEPTRESLDRWIEGNWELEFAIRVAAQREPAE